jgi:hypothetical protein
VIPPLQDDVGHLGPDPDALTVELELGRPEAVRRLAKGDLVVGLSSRRDDLLGDSMQRLAGGPE